MGNTAKLSEMVGLSKNLALFAVKKKHKGITRIIQNRLTLYGYAFAIIKTDTFTLETQKH
jgi:hypothetical protein